MLSRTIMIGRLTALPEMRYTQDGKAVTNFNIAVERRYSGADGQRKTDFWPVVVWGKAAEACANYLDKGSLVAVDGAMQIDEWEKDGQKHKRAKLVAESVKFLSKKKSESEPYAGTTGDFEDDDIPF